MLQIWNLSLSKNKNEKYMNSILIIIKKKKG